MSYRSQLSPQTSTRGIHLRTEVQSPWASPLGSSPDAQFLLSWLEHDELDQRIARGRINWGAISGLALTVGVSAISWAGFGWMVSHIWR